jgi:hypothetical protein
MSNDRSLICAHNTQLDGLKLALAVYPDAKVSDAKVDVEEGRGLHYPPSTEALI